MSLKSVKQSIDSGHVTHQWNTKVKNTKGDRDSLTTAAQENETRWQGLSLDNLFKESREQSQLSQPSQMAIWAVNKE